MVVGELWTGFLYSSRREQNQKELLAFLNDPAVSEISVDRETALLYAELATDLRRAGTPIPTNDIWIAASAGVSGSTVLTYDEHFLAIRRVSVNLLKPG